MDHVSAGEAKRDGARTRRRHMRDKARAQHGGQSPVSDRYQTPEWLERSFVLPLTRPEASDVPNQSVPRHDDAAYLSPEPRVMEHDARAARHRAEHGPHFVRPPSDDIDFGRMIRRADLCRRAGRLSWATANLAGVGPDRVPAAGLVGGARGRHRLRRGLAWSPWSRCSGSVARPSPVSSADRPSTGGWNLF